MLSENRIREIIAEEIGKILSEDDSGEFNIKNVYHVSSDEFDEFKHLYNFNYFFFSNKPIRLGDDRYEYLCNLSMHNPLVFTEGNSWSYPLWLFLSDRDGNLVSEEMFTRERYDGYLGCPFEFWQAVYHDDNEYSVDEIPIIVKRLNLGYDGVIIKNVQEGRYGDIVDDYIVYEPSQVQVVKKIKL